MLSIVLFLSITTTQPLPERRLTEYFQPHWTQKACDAYDDKESMEYRYFCSYQYERRTMRWYMRSNGKAVKCSGKPYIVSDDKGPFETRVDGCGNPPQDGVVLHD
jgi:hypothetical protein